MSKPSVNLRHVAFTHETQATTNGAMTSWRGLIGPDLAKTFRARKSYVLFLIFSLQPSFFTVGCHCMFHVFSPAPMGFPEAIGNSDVSVILI